MQSDRQARIRERAYQIWVEEGRVHGKDHEHWRRAERELVEAESSGKRPAAARPRRTSAKAPVASEAHPAEVSKSRVKSKSVAEPAKPRARASRSAPAAKADAAKSLPRGRRQSATTKPA